MKKMSSMQYWRIARIGALLGVSLALSAQETPVAPPVVPQVPDNSAPRQQGTTPPSQEQKPGGAAKAGGEPVSSSSYKIGAADVLNVHVWNEAQFSGEATVHQDGMFTLPLVGDLKAGGMTPNEVEEEI